MTSAERITQAARLAPTDRIPFALLSSGAWAINSKDCTLERALTLEPAQVADWLYEGYTAAGSDISWVGSGYNNIVIKALGGKIKFRRTGTPDVSETFLKSLEDAATVDPTAIARDPDIQSIYAVTRELVAREDGRRLVGGSMWGPFTLTGLLFGAESLMRSVYKNPQALDRMLRLSVELYLTYMQGYIDAGAKVIFMAEPSASGDMISRRHFEHAALPYIQEAYRRLSGQGLILGLHICGNTEDRLDLIAGSGAAVMSLDYKVGLPKAKEAFAGKIAFSGNLNPVSVVQNGTRDQIRGEVAQSIQDMGRDSSYIVMPGCDIPPKTPLENLQTIRDAVLEFGA
jgi:uroporphyrinogen decarboxylase